MEMASGYMTISLHVLVCACLDDFIGFVYLSNLWYSCVYYARMNSLPNIENKKLFRLWSTD